MAFPTSRDMLSVGLARVQSQAGSIKRIAQNNRDRMAAGPITSGGILSLLDNINGALETVQVVRALDGIGQYAVAQLGQDVANDFQAMVTELTACRDLIMAAIPKDENGYLLIETMDATGNRIERSFTTAQTAALRTALDALIATVE